MTHILHEIKNSFMNEVKKIFESGSSEKAISFMKKVKETEGGIDFLKKVSLCSLEKEISILKAQEKMVRLLLGEETFDESLGTCQSFQK